MEPGSASKQMRYGIVPPAEAKLISGYEFLKRILEGGYPSPSICKVFQFHLAEVEPGRVVFAGQPTPDYYNPLGAVHGGYAATFLDSCMSCAIHSALPVGFGCTTLEIKVSFIRGMTESTGPITAEGKVISVGKRVGVAEGRIFDAQNTLYALGTTTCLIFPL